MCSKRYKRGDVRDDGMIFWAYRSDNGKERWLDSERFQHYSGGFSRWASARPNYQRDRLRRWNALNAEHVHEYRKEYCRRSDFQKRNNERASRIRYLKKAGTYPELSDAISELYDICAALNLSALASGAEDTYEVDHIYPVCGNGYIGLHVPWNLDIIPMRQNRMKTNKHPEEFYEKVQ